MALESILLIQEGGGPLPQTLSDPPEIKPDPLPAECL